MPRIDTRRRPRFLPVPPASARLRPQLPSRYAPALSAEELPVLPSVEHPTPPSLPTLTPGEEAEGPYLPTYDPAPRTALDDAAARLRGIIAAPVVGNRKRSALYGAGTAAAQAAPSGSLAYTLGAALGGGLTGALDKKLYGRTLKDKAIAEAKEAVGVESAVAKEKRERAEAAADLEYKRAQTENQRQLPVYRTEEQRRKEEEGVRRLDALERRVETTDAYNQGRLGQGDRRLDQSDRQLGQGDQRLTEIERANRAREEDRDEDREQRRTAFAKAHGLKSAEYKLRVETAKERTLARLQRESAAAQTRAGGIVRARISYENARTRAQAEGIDLPDFLDILRGAGVEITGR
ncbi:MAG: hypothetical protein LC742_10565 [Acidobacteria bacterium]|nr:hypothetical protein [Acidobacteriota bacterium]